MNLHCTYLHSINSCDNKSIGMPLQEHKRKRHIKLLLKVNNLN